MCQNTVGLLTIPQEVTLTPDDWSYQQDTVVRQNRPKRGMLSHVVKVNRHVVNCTDVGVLEVKMVIIESLAAFLMLLAVNLLCLIVTSGTMHKYSCAV